MFRSDCPVPGHAGVRLGTAQECVSGSLRFFPSRGDPGLASLAQSQGRANPGSAGTTTHSILTATGRSGRYQPISLRRKAGSERARPRSRRQSPNEGGGWITALAHGKRETVGRSRQLRGPRSRAGCGPRRGRYAALRVHPARPRPAPPPGGRREGPEAHRPGALLRLGMFLWCNENMTLIPRLLRVTYNYPQDVLRSSAYGCRLCRDVRGVANAAASPPLPRLALICQALQPLRYSSSPLGCCPQRSGSLGR